MNKKQLYDYAKLKLNELKEAFEHLPQDLDWIWTIDKLQDEFKEILQEYMLKDDAKEQQGKQE